MSAYGSPLAAQKDDKAESETNTKENEKKNVLKTKDETYENEN